MPFLCHRDIPSFQNLFRHRYFWFFAGSSLSPHKKSGDNEDLFVNVAVLSQSTLSFDSICFRADLHQIDAGKAVEDKGLADCNIVYVLSFFPSVFGIPEWRSECQGIIVKPVNFSVEDDRRVPFAMTRLTT